MIRYKLLIVDDEEDALEFLSYNLRKLDEFEIFTATNGKDAIKIATEIVPHLILLDIMMPESDGITTCEELRKIKSLEKTLIAFLTSRNEDYSQIAGFEAGGDDYIAKPIRPKVLYSRIKALLKRFDHISAEQTFENGMLKKGNILINKEKYVVVINDKELFLPRKEFELLLLLISKPEKVFTREQIFHSVWGNNITVNDRTIDVHIRKLREKIGDDHIKTIKGVGYRFVE